MSDKILKINDGFILRSVKGADGDEKFVVITVGEASKKLNGMITLNSTSVFVWKMLEKGATRNEIITAVANEYEVEASVVENDINELLDKIIKYGVVNGWRKNWRIIKLHGLFMYWN